MWPSEGCSRWGTPPKRCAVMSKPPTHLKGPGWQVDGLTEGWMDRHHIDRVAWACRHAHFFNSFSTACTRLWNWGLGGG